MPDTAQTPQPENLKSRRKPLSRMQYLNRVRKGILVSLFRIDFHESVRREIISYGLLPAPEEGGSLEKIAIEILNSIPHSASLLDPKERLFSEFATAPQSHTPFFLTIESLRRVDIAEGCTPRRLAEILQTVSADRAGELVQAIESVRSFSASHVRLVDCILSGAADDGRVFAGWGRIEWSDFDQLLSAGQRATVPQPADEVQADGANSVHSFVTKSPRKQQTEPQAATTLRVSPNRLSDVVRVLIAMKTAGLVTFTYDELAAILGANKDSVKTLLHNIQRAFTPPDDEIGDSKRTLSAHTLNVAAILLRDATGQDMAEITEYQDRPFRALPFK